MFNLFLIQDLKNKVYIHKYSKKRETKIKDFLQLASFPTLVLMRLKIDAPEKPIVSLTKADNEVEIILKSHLKFFNSKKVDRKRPSRLLQTIFWENIIWVVKMSLKLHKTFGPIVLKPVCSSKYTRAAMSVAEFLATFIIKFITKDQSCLLKFSQIFRHSYQIT